MADDASRFHNLELDDYVTGKAAAPAPRSGISLSHRPGAFPRRPVPRLAREGHWLSNAELQDFHSKLAQIRQNEAVRRKRAFGLLLPTGLMLGVFALFLSARFAPQSLAFSKRAVSATASKATTARKPTHAAPHSRHSHHHRHTTKR